MFPNVLPGHVTPSPWRGRDGVHHADPGTGACARRCGVM
ncbi:hypothetical protein C7S15_5590 [Burkholderia cepacia]|nr:hypothetical protein [Burkholderia cepacia]